MKSQIGRKVRERERDDKCDRERGEVFQSPEREREREIPGGFGEINWGSMVILPGG